MATPLATSRMFAFAQADDGGVAGLDNIPPSLHYPSKSKVDTAVGRAPEATQQASENNDPWKPTTTTQTVSARGPVDARVKHNHRHTSGVRENKAPLGPRPPDFAPRRVTSDASIPLTSTPRRSYLPNATSEPFLGLSARRKTSNVIPALPSSTRKSDSSGQRTDLSLARPEMNGPSTPGMKHRTTTGGQRRGASKEGISNGLMGGAASSHRSGDHARDQLVETSPVRQRNPALRAAQISTASTSGPPIITPLTIRTRRQTQYPATGPDDLEVRTARKVTGPDLVITKPAVKEGLDNTLRSDSRTPQSTGNKNITRKVSNPKPQSYPNVTSLSGNPVQTVTTQFFNPATRQIQYRIAPMIEDRSQELSQPNKGPRTAGRMLNHVLDTASVPDLRRQSTAGGLLARAVSPTDARRLKRVPESTRAESPPPRSPTPELTIGPRPAARSPSLTRRKSDTTSSARASPEANHRFSSGRSLSSRSSYSSLRPSSSSLQHRAFLNNQVSRTSSTRSKNTHSSAGDRSEVVPPVPAIPKAFGSPRETSEEPFFFNFEDSITPSESVTVHQNLRVNPPPVFEPAVEHLVPLHDHRHRRGLTVASGVEPRNFSLLENSARQTSQPVILPPLNLLPLSPPTNAKIESLTQHKAGAVSGELTPPLLRKAVGTPSTPLTASKATFPTHIAQAPFDISSFTNLRNSTSRWVPRSESSRSSSPAVFLTPSPAASRATVSPLIPAFTAQAPVEVEQDSGKHAERNNSFAPQSSLIGSRGENISPKKFTQTSREDQSGAISAPSSNAFAGNSSPTRRTIQQAWDIGASNASRVLQQFTNEGPLQTQKPVVAASQRSSQSAAYIAPTSHGPRAPTNGYDAKNNESSIPTATSTDGTKRNRTISYGTTQGARDILKVPEQPLVISKASSSSMVHAPKTLASRASHSAIKLQQLDAMADMEDLAADEEMIKLASKRKDLETAAKELDELRLRASPKERILPSQASRLEALNIFERGEIVDYKDIYFCGLAAAKKFVGDLSAQAVNFGFDDERGDYNLVMGDHLAYRYEVVDLLGKGSFGQVVRCIDHKTGGLVAVKIIRNKKRFHQQALVEVNILRQLREWDPRCKHSMINFTQSFYFRGHLCISTELLGMNLYEFIKAHEFRGFSLRLIRRFTKQMLSSLSLLQSHNVIHCDLKPENILLSHPLQSEIKVIDFGSSCFETEKVYTYIQSRFYRSPEVILGMAYGMPIDMWSLGCILAELFTGYPIFPGENEQEQLLCIMEVFGPPEKSLVEQCTRKKLFFDSLGKPRLTVSSKGKRRRPSSKTLQQALKCDDEAFLDFITQCLRWDPDRRLKPDKALKHEFVTGTKKRVGGQIALGSGTISPAKRNTLQTPLRNRILPDVPGTSIKSGSAAGGSVSSPIKSGMPVRRHSTISGVGMSVASKRTSTGMAVGSILPRPTPRSVSGKPDLASAAAIASLRQR